jgi:hypothetical protein
LLNERISPVCDANAKQATKEAEQQTKDDLKGIGANSKAKNLGLSTTDVPESVSRALARRSCNSDYRKSIGGAK